MEEDQTSSESANTPPNAYEIENDEVQLDENTIQRHYKMLKYVYEKQALKESLSILFWHKFKLTECDAEISQSPLDLKLEFFTKILKNISKYRWLNRYEREYHNLWNFSSNASEELLKSNDLTIDNDFVYWDRNIYKQLSVDEDEQNVVSLQPLFLQNKIEKNQSHVYSYKMPPKVFQYFYLVTTTEAEKQANIQLTDDAVRARIFTMPEDFNWHNALKIHGHVLGKKTATNQFSNISDISSNASASTAIERPRRRRTSSSCSWSSVGSRCQSIKMPHLYSSTWSTKLIEFRKKLEQRRRGTQRRLGAQRRQT